MHMSGIIPTVCAVWLINDVVCNVIKVRGQEEPATKSSDIK